MKVDENVVESVHQITIKVSVKIIKIRMMYQ